MRRLEIFQDGTAKYFDYLTPFEIGVSQYPKSFDKINRNNEFYVKEISLYKFVEALSHYNLEEIRSDD